jgi:hypothetical protein
MFFNSLADTIFTRPARDRRSVAEERPDTESLQQVQAQGHRSQLMTWFGWTRPSA